MLRFREILFLLVLSLVSLIKIPNIELGIEIPFNETYNEFTYTASSSASLRLYVYHDYECVRYNISGYSTTLGDILSPGDGIKFYVTSNEQIKIKFTFFPKYDKLITKEKKGTFYIYSSSSPTKIDINKKINAYFGIFYGTTDPILVSYETGVIEKDVSVKLEYNKSFKNDIIETENVKNPFKICDENDDCDEYLSSYTFKQGHSYSINIKSYRKINQYIIPGHAIYIDNNKNTNNNNNIKFNILFILFYIALLL